MIKKIIYNILAKKKVMPARDLRALHEEASVTDLKKKVDRIF